MARGNFLSWCPAGYLPLPDYCRPLYVAQMLPSLIGTAGGAEVGENYRVYSLNQARELFGGGSIATLMARAHFATCPELPLFIAPINEPAGGAQAVFQIRVTGSAGASGVVSLAVMDMPFQVSVIIGTAAADIATSLAEVFNRNPDMPFVATVPTGGDAFHLTAKNAGPVGNWFSPRVSPNFGDALPPGIGLEITHEVQGVGTFDPAPVMGVMACPWDCVGLGVEDDQVVEAFIQAVRQNWRCGAQGDFRDGHVFHSKTDTPGQIAAYAWTRSNPEESVVPVRPEYKYPGYLLTAAVTSRVCCGACTDPGRPIQYDNGVLADLYDDLRCATIWAPEEKREFDDSGVLVWDVAYARGVRQASLMIEEPLTTYKYHPMTGYPDAAWTRVEARYITAYFIRALGRWYRQNWASTALVNDGTPIPAGRRAVSPRIMQASILAWIRTTQLGITMDTAESIERMIRVQRTNTPDNCDPHRLSVLIDLDMVNQLARIATSIEITPERSCLPPAVIAA